MPSLTLKKTNQVKIRDKIQDHSRRFPVVGAAGWERRVRAISRAARKSPKPDGLALVNANSPHLRGGGRRVNK